jgi:hypothetical protein
MYFCSVMTELLFECYSVPSVSYGIDSLFSFYANQDKKNEDGIVISAGHTATHIIPVIGGKGALDRTKRSDHYTKYHVCEHGFNRCFKFTDCRTVARKHLNTC